MQKPSQFLVAFFISLGSFEPSTFAQERVESPYQERSYTVVSIDFSGRTKLKTSSYQGWRLPFNSYDLIESETVRRELELVPAQVAKLDTKIDEFKKLQQQLGDRRRTGRIDNTEALREYSDGCRILREDVIHGILLPIQSQRLEEIQTQLACRRHGAAIIVKLHESEIGKEITPQTKQKIFRSSSKLAEDLVETVHKKCLLSMEKFKAKVPVRFRDSISKSLENNPQYLNLDILQITSKRLLDRLKSGKSFDQGKTLRERLCSSEYYLLQSDGGWITKTGLRSFDSAILYWIADPQESGLLDLELTDDQLANLGELTSSISGRIKETNKAVNRMFDEGKRGQKINDYLKQENDGLSEFAENEFFNILLPHQTESLEKKLDAFDAAKNGPFHSLEGKFEGTEKQQCLSALESFQKAISAIQSEASGLERDMLLDSLEPLGDEVAKKLIRKFGEELQHVKFSQLVFMDANKTTARGR